jgi:hypothetical protein
MQTYMKQISFVLVFLLVYNFYNCAFMNPKNRPVTSYLDQEIEVKSTTKKVMLSPVAIPVGLVTLVSDIFLIHPVSSIIPAAQDASEALWEKPQGGVLSQTFLFLPKVILTVPFILVDTLIRSLFDVTK